MNSDYSAEIQASLDRAVDSLGEAETLLEKGYFDGTASRAYYAAFHAVSALLLTRELSFGKHSAAISAFHRDFVKPGTVRVELGRWLGWLSELRSVGDY